MATSEGLSPIEDGGQEQPISAIRSFKELIDIASGRSYCESGLESNSGLAEQLPFPFLGIVGQMEMKIALLLAFINPAVGGVLLIGPRGTGKTTAARSLLNLLPDVTRSACFYGCLPEDVENGGIDAICPNCAKKYAEGVSLTIQDRVHFIELPLNATLEDVVGGLDERALVHERLRLKRGILAQADQNLLYIDEINLLSNDIIDAILDAAAQGKYTVRRGPISATYWSRFILVGSMNPEEGNLRPQIMDRFGLRAIVPGLSDPDERLEAYRRVQAYITNPRQSIAHYCEETEWLKSEIQSARQKLPRVRIEKDIARIGINIIQQMNIDSLRAEITLFESARAYAAADGRLDVNLEDLHAVAPLTLRLRRSEFMANYLSQQKVEEEEIHTILHHFI